MRVLDIRHRNILHYSYSGPPPFAVGLLPDDEPLLNLPFQLRSGSCCQSMQQCIGTVGHGRDSMKIALVLPLFLATASPVLAGSTGASRNPPSTITCETVRAYVSLLGLAQAKAMARANGMTAVQERKAAQCLLTS